ncbi:hypothetical protein ASZ90_007095 [hydrocarbon metagenome]|uniref:Uncharacterized protein n=1 Tax=hydrocarbon metagenome TaxID=938273 RepID=A0A0W8FQ87_9ZZZZ
MLHANDTIILWIAQGSAAEQAGLKGANATSYGDLIPGDAIVATDGKPKKGQFMCFLQTERLTFHNFLDT